MDSGYRPDSGFRMRGREYGREQDLGGWSREPAADPEERDFNHRPDQGMRGHDYGTIDEDNGATDDGDHPVMKDHGRERELDQYGDGRDYEMNRVQYPEEDPDLGMRGRDYGIRGPDDGMQGVRYRKPGTGMRGRDYGRKIPGTEMEE